MNPRKQRPVFLSVTRIAMPMTARISIAHRVSGVLLFLALPFLIYLLEQSLRSAEDFVRLQALLQQPVVMVVIGVLVWALVHHFIAGLRYLALDVLGGMDRVGARRSAWLVVVAEVIVLLAILGCVL